MSKNNQNLKKKGKKRQKYRKSVKNIKKPG